MHFSPCNFRRGSWRPIGHMRPSSPLLDSVRDQFEDYDQLAKDFTRFFLNTEPNNNAMMFDVSFLVGQSKQKVRFIGVRAILGVRSRWILINFSLADQVYEKHVFVRVAGCFRKFCTGFRRGSAPRRCRSPKFSPEPFLPSTARINQKVATSFKCLT